MKALYIALATILSAGPAESLATSGSRKGSASTDLAVSLGSTTPSPDPAPLYSVDGRVPSRFSLYSSVAIEGKEICVVGAVGDEDGMNKRPFVYVAKTPGGEPRWAKELGIPELFYEGRATGCLSEGKSLYVLLHVETNSQRTIAQTLIYVVKLQLDNGVVEKETEVLVPGADGPYLQWVHDHKFGFRKVGNLLLVTGMYRYLDTDDDRPFSATVDM